MIKFERIYEDADGFPHMDDYFDYIKGVAHLMPESLRDFAITDASYELTGDATLHDSRMCSFQISKQVGEDGVTSTTMLDVTLLHQSHEKYVLLTYGGVLGYSVFEEGVLERERGVDVLLHEVSVLERRGYRHVVQFEQGGGYSVDFLEFGLTYRDVVHPSGS